MRLHARHIQVEGQQIAEEHHEQNAAHTAQRRRIAERPRVHRERKEHRAHQKCPRLQQADRIRAQLLPRAETVIHRHAHRAADARDQARPATRRTWSGLRAWSAAYSTEQCEHDAHELIQTRLSARSRAGDQQHHHRRQILHDRADGGIGKLDGPKVQKLAHAHAEHTGRAQASRRCRAAATARRGAFDPSPANTQTEAPPPATA